MFGTWSYSCKVCEYGEKNIEIIEIYVMDEISMIRQVYETLKEDSRKGEFADLVRKDLEEVKIYLSDEGTMTISKMD